MCIVGLWWFVASRADEEDPMRESALFRNIKSMIKCSNPESEIQIVWLENYD